jgi:hypothetical protein
MTKTSPAQVAFNAGEIDPLLHARFDYQRFQTGLETCRGFLPLPQGGVTRAPGTTYLGMARSSACILIPFQFAADDAVVLELTPGIMRVWRYGVPVLKPDNSGPYELAIPYTDLTPLRWVQSADVIYLVDGIHPPQRLSRFALNNWTIAPQVIDTGPFRVQNLDKDKVITANTTTGSVALTSNFDFFTAAHVGSLLQLTPTDNSTIPLWTSNEDLRKPRSILTGSLIDLVGGGEWDWDSEGPPPAEIPIIRRYGKNVYRLTQGNNAGENPPIHEEGEALVNNDPTKWLYLNDDVGIVRITSVGGPRAAMATVLRPLSIAVVASPTYRWSEGAFSDVHGYPSSIELFDQRMVFAATPSEPRTAWFSTVGAFSDFLPSVEADGAFAYTIAGSESQNRITGLRRGRSGLHIFALSEEYSTRSETRAQVIGPTTAVFGLDGSSGAAPGRPIAPDGDPIFITRDGRKVMLITYDLQRDANRELNLIRASQHIGAVGLKKIVWQQSPEPRAWILRDGGDLAVMIYDASEEILGWSTHSVDGEILDICVTQNPDGSKDEVYLVVSRNIAGGPLVTSIERLDFGHHLMMARVVDLRTTLGPSVNTISVPWLSGGQICVELQQTGKPSFETLRPVVPADGVVTLSEPSRYVVAGLEPLGQRLVTLDIQAAARDGSSLGRNKRLHPACGLVLHQTRGGLVRAIERHGPKMPDRLLSPVPILDPGVAIDSGGTFTGTTEIEVPTGQAKSIHLEFIPVGNAPLTIMGLIPTVQEAGR